MKPENIFSALSALRQEGRLRQVQDLRMETASSVCLKSAISFSKLDNSKAAPEVRRAPPLPVPKRTAFAAASCTSFAWVMPR